MREAEQFAEEDKRRREEADIRNEADSVIYTAEKTKKDLADKISKGDIEKIDKAVSELTEALGGKDVGKIKAKNEELVKVLQEVGTAVYQQAAQREAEQRKTEQPGGSKEKVVDADYKEVKEG